MSLEQSLQNIADALNNLAAAVQGKGQTTLDLTKGQHSEATAGKSSKPAADKPKETAKPEAAATPPTAAAQATAPAEKAASSAKPLDYDKDLQPRFLEYVRLYGREAAQAMIAEYKPGAPRLRDAITPDQYAEVLARVNALIAEKA